MELRKIVLKEKEINDKIEFNIKEMTMLEELSQIDKYKNSRTLEERFNKYYEETLQLLSERKILKEIIDLSEDIFKLSKESLNELNIEEISLLKK